MRQINSIALQVDWMYFIAFAGVAVGLVIYSMYMLSKFMFLVAPFYDTFLDD